MKYTLVRIKYAKISTGSTSNSLFGTFLNNKGAYNSSLVQKDA